MSRCGWCKQSLGFNLIRSFIFGFPNRVGILSDWGLNVFISIKLLRITLILLNVLVISFPPFHPGVVE